MDEDRLKQSMFALNVRKNSRKKTQKNMYLDPEELRASIVEMQALGHMTDRFAKNLMLVADHVMQFPRFVRYPDEIKEEMKSYNVYRWVKSGWKSVNPDKNPFAYLTQACYLNFLQALTNHFRELRKYMEAYKSECERCGIEWKDSGWLKAEKDETREEFERRMDEQIAEAGLQESYERIRETQNI